MRARCASSCRRCSSCSPPLVAEAPLLVGLAPALLRLPALAGLDVALHLRLATAAPVPLALVLARAALGLAPLHLVVAADLGQVVAIAPRLDPVLPQPAFVRPGDPDLVAMAGVAPHRNRRAHVGAKVGGDVVAADVGCQHAARGDEAPVRLGHVRVVVVTRRRPADGAVALPPLHPCRSPHGVRPPDPAIDPHPAPVVIGRPAERIGRHPGETVVRVFPVAVRIRHVAGRRWREHPAVLRVVVPAAVRRELVVEDLDRRDVRARHVDGDVAVGRLGIGRRRRRGLGRRWQRRRLGGHGRRLHVARLWVGRLGRLRRIGVRLRGLRRLRVGLRLRRWRVVRLDVAAECRRDQQGQQEFRAHGGGTFRWGPNMGRTDLRLHSRQISGPGCNGDRAC